MKMTSAYLNGRDEGRLESRQIIERLTEENRVLREALSVALKYLSGGNGMASEDVAAIVNAALATRQEKNHEGD